ncbi:MAG: glutathione S-transferase [Pseudomonadota bacterium]
MYLIEDGRAPNPRRVRIFLAEKNITVERRQIDINKNEQRSQELTALNPFQRIPVLVFDDGTALSESVAICRYFEETTPEPSLFGKGARQKAEVEMWNRRAETTVLFHVAQGFRHTHPAMSEMEVPQIKDWGLINQNKIDPILGHFDKHLQKNEFLAGETFSIADITLLVGVDFMRVLKRRIPETMTALQRWHDDVSARPSSKA